MRENYVDLEQSIWVHIVYQIATKHFGRWQKQIFVVIGALRINFSFPARLPRCSLSVLNLFTEDGCSKSRN